MRRRWLRRSAGRRRPDRGKRQAFLWASARYDGADPRATGGSLAMHRAILAAAVLGLTPPAFAQEACPALSRDESIAIARQFHEEVINRRNPAVLDTILADSIRHHAAGGYPDEMDAAGVK